MKRRNLIVGAGAGLAAPRMAAAAPAPSDLRQAARDAWLFALPLIELAALRAHPGSRGGEPTPINKFAHARSLAGPTSRAVTTPNNDTLFSSAFVDTTRGPVRLHIPDSGKRYLSVQITDMYTNNNFILGPRTPGGAAGIWHLISPDSIPRDSRDLRRATPHAWLLARTLVDGPADLPAAHAIQNRLEVQGPAFPPPVSHATRTSAWPLFFAAAQQLLSSDPPQFKNGLDAFLKVRAAGNGGDFSRAGYGPGEAAAIDAGVAEAAGIARPGQLRRSVTDGWTYPRPDLGEYRDNFRFRAIVAIAGLGVLNPAEAMYMWSAGDANGIFYGDRLYRLHLPRPIPVDGFWSLTMYEATGDGQFFLTENELNRYSIGDRTQGLLWDPDGSLDIWIGRSNPGGTRTANWLPAPVQGPFALTMRAYLPRVQLLDGSYRLPAIA